MFTTLPIQKWVFTQKTINIHYGRIFPAPNTIASLYKFANGTLTTGHSGVQTLNITVSSTGTYDYCFTESANVNTITGVSRYDGNASTGLGTFAAPDMRIFANSSPVISGNMYVVSGSNLIRFDGISSSSTGHTTDSYYSAATLNNVAFLIGGPSNTSRIRRYTGTSASTVESNSLSVVSNTGISSSVLGAKIYIFGSNFSAPIISYDGTTSVTESQSTSAIALSAAATANDVYIFGGINALPTNETNSINTIQKYTGSAVSNESATLPQVTYTVKAGVMNTTPLPL